MLKRAALGPAASLRCSVEQPMAERVGGGLTDRISRGREDHDSERLKLSVRHHWQATPAR